MAIIQIKKSTKTLRDSAFDNDNKLDIRLSKKRIVIYNYSK